VALNVDYGDYHGPILQIHSISARSYRGPAGGLRAVMERDLPYCRLEELTICHEFEPICPSVSVHIVPPPCPQSQASYDYSATAHLSASARKSTRRWIDDHGLERCEFPEQFSIHSH
jgi:hypothetical protein